MRGVHALHHGLPEVRGAKEVGGVGGNVDVTVAEQDPGVPVQRTEIAEDVIVKDRGPLGVAVEQNPGGLKAV